MLLRNGRVWRYICSVIVWKNHYYISIFLRSAIVALPAGIVTAGYR